MPGGLCEKRIVEGWADQVCRGELLHSNLVFAFFRRCYSHDNVRLVGTLDARAENCPFRKFHSPWAGRICAESCEPVPVVTTTSEPTDLWLKRCAGLSPSQADRKHWVALNPWRPSSPLRPGLGFRYTQALLRKPLGRICPLSDCPMKAPGTKCPHDTTLPRRIELRGLRRGVYESRPKPGGL